jgi:hypothetical protein
MSDYNYTVNLDDDNKLNATRHGDLVVVRFDAKFGEITTLKVNGEEGNDCMMGCSLIANKSEPLMLVFNIWVGRAYTELEPTQEEGQTSIDITQLATAFLALLDAFIVARLVSRIGKSTCAATFSGASLAAEIFLYLF